MNIARTTALRRPPHWLRVCLSAFLALGVAGMLNMFMPAPDATALESTHSTAISYGSLAEPIATTGSSGHHLAPVAPTHDSGLSMSDCCGLVMLCMAMIVGIGAFVHARRTSGWRVMWQLPRPHTFSLGSAVAPFYSSTPLQRTAVLRL